MLVLLLLSLSSAGAVETDKSGRTVEVDLVATDVDSAAFSHTLTATTVATVGRGEWEGEGEGEGGREGEGEEGAERGDRELGREVGGVVGSRSVTTRIVKRGRTEMERVGRGEGGEEEAGGWEAAEYGESEECGVSEVGRVSSWKEVERTLVSALTRLQWQRVSEFESGSRVDDGECGEGVAEEIGAGLNARGAAAEEARVIVLSSVDNCTATKVSEARDCDVSN